MKLKFSRGEYWLLESVVEHPIPISWLIRDDLEEALNKQSHGLSPTDVLATLADLAANGLIAATRAREDKPFSPTHQEIVDASTKTDRNQYCHYRVTSAGGRAWESFAAPNWNMFVNAYGQAFHGDKLAGVIETAKPSLAISYLAGIHYVGAVVDHQSIAAEELAPWEATYWKTLPSGYRIRYTYRDSEVIPDWGAIPSSYSEVYSPRWYKWQTGT